MAAETLTATRAASTFPVAGDGMAGNVKVAIGTYELAANVEDGDIFEMCKVPANAVVFNGRVYADDLDTNATETLDMDVGWAANGTDAADPDGFGNLGVWTGDAVAGVKPEVGINMPLGGVLMTAGAKKFSAETTIQVEANAAAATGGTGTLTVWVQYFIDPNYAV
jgi:hypothetical protein